MNSLSQAHHSLDLLSFELVSPMRLFLIFSILHIGLLIDTVIASECNVTVRPNDRSSDLTKKLSCLEQRISKLEQKIERLQVSVGRTVSSPANLDARIDTLKRKSSNNVYEKKDIKVELEKCAWSNDGNIYCQFQILNILRKDKTVCFGGSSRLVTDTGASFSISTYYDAEVGSKNGRISPYDKKEICDVALPLSKVRSWIKFVNSRGQAESKIQFIRLDCGSGCQLEAYDIPIQ